MSERAERLFFFAVTVLAALPFLLVDFVPLDDAPEHVLGVWLETELAQPGSLAHILYQPTDAPPSSLLLHAILRGLLVFLSPAGTLKLLCFALPVAMAYAVRAHLAQAEPVQRATAVFALLFVFDVSFYKGFLNAYLGLAAMVFAVACLRRGRYSLFGFAAIVTILSHPLPFVLLGFVCAIEVARSPERLARTALASIPALVIASWMLSLLIGGVPSGTEFRAEFLFGPQEKITRFFHEGWGTIAAWQPFMVMAGAAVLLTQLRKPPILALALLALYLVTPEAVTGWWWISIRIPMLVMLFWVVHVAKRAPARPWVPAVGAVLVLIQAVATHAEVRRLSDAIGSYVAAAPHLEPGKVILPILPSTYPSVGRVNVLHHATAYLAMERAVAYPEVFARDARVHSALVRPEAEVFGMTALPWTELVSLERRAEWFEQRSEATAIAFEPPTAIADRLAAASREVVKVNDRVTVYRRRPEAAPAGAEAPVEHD